MNICGMHSVFVPTKTFSDGALIIVPGVGEVPIIYGTSVLKCSLK